MNNKMLRRAVEREFEIIGEAMGRIDKLNPDIMEMTLAEEKEYIRKQIAKMKLK